MTIYTAITFAPVQGFIEKSRKLRDLYGSSFLLSYLAKAICEAAREYYSVDKYNPPPESDPVVSPAIINVTQGTPNQIIIRGDEAFDEGKAQAAFNSAWNRVVNSIRNAMEKALPQPYHWQRNWNQWANYAWEFFWGEGETISEAREAINETKRSRNWVGINWVGESSTLSGGDAVAWYGMSDRVHPKEASMGDIDAKVKDFYSELSQTFSNSIVDINERLSIPELIKRLITLRDIAEQLELSENDYPTVEIPQNFRDINRIKDDPQENRWTGWFQGDGDRIGDYLKNEVKHDPNKHESEVLTRFSKAMLNWGNQLKYSLPKPTYSEENKVKKLDSEGRIIYAGGDDFLGVLYRNDEPKLTAEECLNWFYKFPKVWSDHEIPITVSVGFVWAAPGVPQRDVLQHCRETESFAKKNGRDRLAIRILFNSGNYLDWQCPWWLLPEVLTSYRDRNNQNQDRSQSPTNRQNWTHIYNDAAFLESRHAFKGNKDIALELFQIYFGEEQRNRLEKDTDLWNRTQENKPRGGILGEKTHYLNSNNDLDWEKCDRAISDWIINLAKVGFHLCQ